MNLTAVFILIELVEPFFYSVPALEVDFRDTVGSVLLYVVLVG